MSEGLYLDTHAVVWLYDKIVAKFSKKGRDAIESSNLFVSPIVMLELEYLFEIDRLQVNAISILDYLERRIDVRIDESLKSSHWFITSLQEKWTRDPFDRLIVSHAKVKGAALLSQDKIIQKNYPKAFW